MSKDNIYSVRFTGKYLKSNDAIVEANIHKKFSGKTDLLLKSIAEKSCLKKNIDLLEANKIKTKYEKLDIECIIESEKNHDLLVNNKKLGIFMVMTCIFISIAVFLASNGYQPRSSFIFNILNNVYIIDVQVCKQGLKNPLGGCYVETFFHRVYYKDFLILMMIPIIYGLGTYLGFLNRLNMYIFRRLHSSKN